MWIEALAPFAFVLTMWNRCAEFYLPSSQFKAKLIIERRRENGGKVWVATLYQATSHYWTVMTYHSRIKPESCCTNHINNEWMKHKHTLELMGCFSNAISVWEIASISNLRVKPKRNRVSHCAVASSDTQILEAFFPIVGGGKIQHSTQITVFI